MEALQDSTLFSFSGSVARIWLNRPDRLNAINADLLKSLKFSLERVKERQDCKLLVIGSTCERAFCSGIDIRTVIDLGEGALRDFIHLGNETFEYLRSFEIPVIAAVNNFALGSGLALALSCDLIIAVEEAILGFPEANLGWVPTFGAFQLLTNRCSAALAKKIFFTAELMKASETLSFGLVDVCCPVGSLKETVNEMAMIISEKSPLSIKAAKKMLLVSDSASEDEELIVQTFLSEDRFKAMQSFLKKEKPEFSGC